MKIHLDTVGCRLNQAEIELYARQLEAAGHTVVASAAEAEVAVVNTCAVTGAAAADSRKKLRRAADHGARVIATGCWATIATDEAAALAAGPTEVVPNERKDRLVFDLFGLTGDPFATTAPRHPLPGARGRTRAFIKVQDGCDQRCAFCLTTVARGNGRSVSPEAVATQVAAAEAGGAKEVILTGVHLGSWGRDLTPRRTLADLITALLEGSHVPRLALSSLEPWAVTRELLTLWRDPRLAPRLHLPLQSGCAATLRRMHRPNPPERFAAIVAAAREAIPEVAITTDLIAGFPGESEAEHAQSLAFVAGLEFAGGHCFPFSPRPGTIAASLADQLPTAQRKERAAELRAVVEASGRRYRRRLVGETVEVLWETAHPDGDGYRLSGRSRHGVRVVASSAAPTVNELGRVVVAAVDDRGVSGRLAE